MLKKITIENFKGIKEPLSIDIKPITLLFGPNNAGKSSIIQAFHFAREIFINNNLNPRITETGGDGMDLGGFKNLIHNHDLNSAITLTFYFRFNKKNQFPYVEPEKPQKNQYKSSPSNKSLTPELIADIFGSPDLDNQHNKKEDKSNQMENSLKEIKTLVVRFSLKWNESKKQLYVELCRVYINGHILFQIIKLLQFNNPLKIFVYNHEILSNTKIDELIEMQEIEESYKIAEEENELHEAYRASSYRYESVEYTDWSDSFDDRDSDDWEEHYDEEHYDKDEEDDDDDEMDKNKNEENIRKLTNSVLKPFSNYTDSFDLVDISPLLLSRDGLLPERGWNSSLSGFIKISEDDYQYYINTLSNIMKSSITVIQKSLEPFFYIGPLRKIPVRNNTVFEQTDRSRWASGLSAYDIISQSDNTFINKVNYWLSNKKCFNTEYNIQCKRYKQLDVESKLMNTLINCYTLNAEHNYNNEIIKEQLLELPEKNEIFLLKQNCDVRLFLQDVGTGISQILPIIVGALKLNSEKNNSLLSIEQPELHIHPAMQIVLGDFFIDQVSNRNLNLLIETHSEHLLLRILRRISETTNNELPSGVKGFKANDLAVLYVKNINGKTTVTKLEVDESGDFKNKWPDGFFEERDEELFLK